MEFHPRLLEYAKTFQTIDSHTMGEPTRIIIGGFPLLEGETMMDRKKYLVQHYDHYRRALMLEPRGHRDMFGALLTEPAHEEADLGVIFMDSGGYLNMCGHGSIGAATVAVETGLVPVTEPYTEVVLDAPSGIIRTRVKVEHGKAVEVSILNVPAFLYRSDLTVEVLGYGSISYDIAFGGSFFILVDAETIGLKLEMSNVARITDLGMLLLKKVNESVEIRHPYLDITTVDLCEFYCSPVNPVADKKNVVIFGGAQADRSPCGTGTSAKLATLYAKGELQLGQEFVYESITGSLFRGEAVKEIKLNEEITAIIPRITGSAYLTGVNTWILDDEDPLEYGFLFGSEANEPGVSPRVKLIKASWELFHEKGYEDTSIEEICERAGVSRELFETYFPRKQALTETLADLFDEKYAELMIQMDPQMSRAEALLYLNRELFALIEQTVPITLLAERYSSQIVSRQKEKKQLLNRNRLYYRLIHQLVEEGRERGEWKSDHTNEEIADRYALFERGMLYDWCAMDGEYPLTEQSQRMLTEILKSYQE